MLMNYATKIATLCRAKPDYFWLHRESSTGYYIHVHLLQYPTSVMEAGYISDYTEHGGKVYMDLHGIPEAECLEFDTLQQAIEAVGVRYHPVITPVPLDSGY